MIYARLDDIISRVDLILILLQSEILAKVIQDDPLKLII